MLLTRLQALKWCDAGCHERATLLGWFRKHLCRVGVADRARAV